MKIGVIGTRKRNGVEDFELLKGELERRNLLSSSNSFVSGGCKSGADSFIERIANDNKIEVVIYEPQTKKKMPYYQVVKEMYKRNEQIAENCDILIALVESKNFNDIQKRKGGTNYTIRHFLTINTSKNLILL